MALWLAVSLVGCSGQRAPRQPDGEAPARTAAGRHADPSPVAAAEDLAAEAASAEDELAGQDLEPVGDALSEEVQETEAAAAEETHDDEMGSAEALAQALEAYESAQVFWLQESFEDAFAALDRAYGLMASVPINGDPIVAQEKEDLRRLIASRVVEMHASRRTHVGDIDRSIQIEINEHVEREIRSFQGPERKFFLESYARSGRYRDMILEEIRAAGLPEQIAWLPLVESGFKVRAYSHARALGLWQFIPSTGYRFGLERDTWIDERMDPLKATRAAIAYLTELHNLFGDWTTALAGYNCGEHNVLRAIKRQQISYLDQFWDLYNYLPRETRRYVPRFLATVIIMQEPEKYGFELPSLEQPYVTDAIEISRSIDLSSLERSAGLAPETLKDLNPELRRQVTPPHVYALRVPDGQEGTLLAKIDEVPKATVPAAGGVHRVRRGETLSQVAARYGTSVSTLMALNNLRSANRLAVGQSLVLPGGATASSSGRGSSKPPSSGLHRVRSGESLWSIANKYGTSIDRLKRDNNLRSNTLRPGQTLRIATGSGGSSGGAYVVRRGDTLGRIASSLGVPLSRLLDANGLRRSSTIYPGQRLLVP